MFVRVCLFVVFILNGEQGLIRGQGPIGGEGDNDCCPFISVNVEGSNADLKGDYRLTKKSGSKPEDVCINGCIYTKEGSPSTHEYCFKADNAIWADVKCPVGMGLLVS